MDSFITAHPLFEIFSFKNTWNSINNKKRHRKWHIKWKKSPLSASMVGFTKSHTLRVNNTSDRSDYVTSIQSMQSRLIYFGLTQQKHSLYLPIARKPHRTHFCTIMSLEESVDTTVGYTIPDLDASISSCWCINLGIRRIPGTKFVQCKYYKLNSVIRMSLDWHSKFGFQSTGKVLPSILMNLQNNLCTYFIWNYYRFMWT
jgi:hypothetical protein